MEVGTISEGAAAAQSPRKEARTPEGVAILTRKMDFAFDRQAIPRYWYRNNPGLTLFLYTLSTLFPEGERFFMDSVRHFRDQVKDPVLQKQIRGFLGQEAQHSKEHRDYNERAQREGFSTGAIDKLVGWGLGLLRKFTGPLDQLAVTAALEHFTAMMATQLLEKPDFAVGAHPEHTALWRWHAIEETEHKAVAFDVYKAVGGGYFRRVLWMFGVTVGFPFAIGAIWLCFMAQDWKLFDVKSWWGLFHWLLVKPGFARGIVPEWFSYFRPGFHPWDYDNSKYIEIWKKEWAPVNYTVLGT